MQTAPTIIWRSLVSCYIDSGRNRLRSVPSNTKTIMFYRLVKKGEWTNRNLLQYYTELIFSLTIMFVNKPVVSLVMWRRWRIIPLLKGTLDCHVVWPCSLKMEPQISFETSVPVHPAATRGHISEDQIPHRKGLANLPSRVCTSCRINATFRYR
jgi:hypothetical protein